MTAQPAPTRAYQAWTPDPVRQRLANYTLEDVLGVPSDAPRIELRDGVMIAVPSPTVGHQNTANLLWMWWWHNSPREYVAATNVGVAISATNTFEPDVLLLRAPVPDTSHYVLPEQVVIVVEVVSPGTVRRDPLEKPAAYADAGVPYYWRIEQNSVLIYAYERNSDGLYRLVADSDTELVLDKPFEIRLPISEITP